MILCALGTWQLQRLQWKEGVLVQIDDRIAQPPSPIPRTPQPEFDNYLAVEVEGVVQEGELFVLGSRKGLGPGFRVIAPFELEGRRILLDRGFIPELARHDLRQTGTQRVVGNLQWPNEVDPLFTPKPEDNLWFARDVAAMATILATDPILLVARQVVPESVGISPWPVDSSGIPNNHKNYAITWYLLAIAWFGMTMFWIWRIRRESGN